MRTEPVYVPADIEKEYIRFLLDNHLGPRGKLPITNYAEGLENPERGSLPSKDGVCGSQL